MTARSVVPDQRRGTSGHDPSLCLSSTARGSGGRKPSFQRRGNFFEPQMAALDIDLSVTGRSAFHPLRLFGPPQDDAVAMRQQPTIGRLDEFEQLQARGEGDHGSEVPCGLLASEGDALEALHAARDMTQRYGFAKQARISSDAYPYRVALAR